MEHQKTHSAAGLWGSFGISEGNITGRKKHTQTHTHTHTNCMPNHNSQWRSSPDTQVQESGTEQGAVGCVLRVRIRPECPENNLRELR